MLPAKVPLLASLDLPPGTETLARLPRGLVIIGGATGSGKTTTLAALVDEINRRDAKHIITIEDPIEYEHANHKSVIQQVEIGVDAPDFPTALRSALRQAPDVIVVGEMRDPETMRIALAAGETGHLVLTTLHTTDVPSTLARMTDSFPAERQPTIRQEIAAALSAVFVQTLLPRPSGGRVPAAELLVVSYGARQHIRRNQLQHLHQEITITRKHGSFTLEDCLARLVKSGVVERGDAALRANHPDDFEHALGCLMAQEPSRRVSNRARPPARVGAPPRGRVRRARGGAPVARRHGGVAGVPVALHRRRAGRPSAAADAQARYTTVEFSTDLGSTRRACATTRTSGRRRRTSGGSSCSATRSCCPCRCRSPRRSASGSRRGSTPRARAIAGA